MIALINKFEKYDKTGAIPRGMVSWIPTLAVFFTHRLLPDKFILFFAMVCFLSLLAIFIYLKVEGKFSPAQRIILGCFGWFASAAMVMLYVYNYYGNL